MKILSYSFISDFVKLIIPLLAAAASYWQYDSDNFKVVSVFCSMIAVSTLIIITLFDKMRKDLIDNVGLLERKINSLSDDLETNFEYHGLLDSPKDHFTAIEMREKWPLIVEKVKRDFHSINYLNYKYWCSGGGDKLCDVLGHKTNQAIVARRILVIDSLNELVDWRRVIDLHIKNNIGIKYILKSDYEIIKKADSNKVPLCYNTNGFNVIDREKPGIVLDWYYTNNRSVDGALLKRGQLTAQEYYSFFMLVWNDQNCLTFSDAVNYK